MAASQILAVGGLAGLLVPHVDFCGPRSAQSVAAAKASQAQEADRSVSRSRER